MRRLLTASMAALALAVPATATAQVPVPPGGQPPTPHPPARVDAKLKVRIASGLRDRGRRWSVAGQRVRVRGHMNKAAAGETVVVELWRGGKRRQHRNARVGKKGKFKTRLRPHVRGRFRVRAVHRRSKKVNAGSSRFVRLSVVRGRANSGDGGPRVRLLQKGLARMRYAVPKSGRFDDGTARAVLAYRKVNGMSRTTRANRTIFKRVFAGRGMFRLKYKRPGKHVEADLSKQVIVLAQDGKPWRVYVTSSGKASTPTIKGRFSFYSQTPGYNAKEMYYSNYFIRGYAIHGYHSVPTYPASHGCLRIPLANAVSVYRWIGLGDTIYVYGKGKQPGPRARPGP